MSKDTRQLSLFIPVPESEAVVEDLRLQYDPYRLRGVPAHITIFGPFDEPDDKSFRIKLKKIFQSINSFEFKLATVEKFYQNDKTQVVYLTPDTSKPFTDLHDLAKNHLKFMDTINRAAFAYVPHETVAVHESVEGYGATAEQLDEIALRLGKPSLLPIMCHANEVWLMPENTAANSFRILERFKLGKH